MHTYTYMCICMMCVYIYIYIYTLYDATMMAMAVTEMPAVVKRAMRSGRGDRARCDQKVAKEVSKCKSDCGGAQPRAQLPRGYCYCCCCYSCYCYCYCYRYRYRYRYRYSYRYRYRYRYRYPYSYT